MTTPSRLAAARRPPAHRLRGAPGTLLGSRARSTNCRQPAQRLAYRGGFVARRGSLRTLARRRPRHVHRPDTGPLPPYRSIPSQPMWWSLDPAKSHPAHPFGVLRTPVPARLPLANRLLPVLGASAAALLIHPSVLPLSEDHNLSSSPAPAAHAHRHGGTPGATDPHTPKGRMAMDRKRSGPGETGLFETFRFFPASRGQTAAKACREQCTTRGIEQ